MRQFFTLTLLTYSVIIYGQSEKIAKIRFDGFYQSISEIDTEDKDTTWTYLRFYPSGQVISVGTEGTAFDITSWFKLDFDNVSKGHYEINNNQLYFSTTSKSGTVIYKGKIVDEHHLSLKIKSLINGYKAREKYYFVKINDLK